jgi:CBS domain containing-hemolysin-like protein
MSPRTEIIAVDLFDSMKILRIVYRDRLLKIVVYQNSLDDIIGYVHSFDLFKSQKY